MDELADVLNQELETFNRFLVLLDDQNRQIAKNDIESLAKTNADLDVLSNQASDLERFRQSLTEEISAQMRLENHNPSLNELLSRLEGISSERLQTLRRAILEVHSKIAEKSKRNKFLIDKSRFLIAESMKIMSSRPSATYERPRAEKMANGEGGLVNRSA
jgi:DNA repair exonuclease SbcCD ATPase subunit